jgi:hypothetical protein
MHPETRSTWKTRIRSDAVHSQKEAASSHPRRRSEWKAQSVRRLRAAQAARVQFLLFSVSVRRGVRAKMFPHIEA